MSIVKISHSGTQFASLDTEKTRIKLDTKDKTVRDYIDVELTLSGNATAADLLSGKTALNANGEITGAIPQYAWDELPIPVYNVQLTGISSYGWSLGTVTNPDPHLYDGVYQSENKGIDNSQAVMKITFRGYENFKIYIRSYAESNYDYTIASTLDAASYPTAYSGSNVKAHTRGNQKSGTSISNYTLVEYPNDGGEHFIYIVFTKDSSSASGDDRGYVLISKD